MPPIRAQSAHGRGYNAVAAAKKERILSIIRCNRVSALRRFAYCFAQYAAAERACLPMPEPGRFGGLRAALCIRMINDIARNSRASMKLTPQMRKISKKKKARRMLAAKREHSRAKLRVLAPACGRQAIAQPRRRIEPKGRNSRSPSPEPPNAVRIRGAPSGFFVFDALRISVRTRAPFAMFFQASAGRYQ